MKKLTKLTALALALALVLGMTVMAAPTEVIKSVDFTQYETIDAFKADAIVKTTTKNDPVVIGEGGYVYDKTYYQTALVDSDSKHLNINEIAGKKVIAASNGTMKFSADQAPNQVGFTFPEAWVYDEDYAYVAEMEVAAAARTRTGVSYHYQKNKYPGIAALLSTKAADEDETSSVRTLSGWYLDDQYFATLPADQSRDLGNTNSVKKGSAIPNNSIGKLRTVIRPFEGKEESLDLITGFDRMASFNTYHSANYPAVTKAHGLVYSDVVAYEKWGYAGYRFFKVSLDPTDFTITSATNIADLGETDDVVITFSQPITTFVADVTGVETLETLITVNDGENDLVYGEDYTIVIDEKANGNAIYDEMTIAPVGAWDFGKNYTVTFPEGFKNIARVPMAETAVVNFATVAAPTFDITLKAYKGLSASDATALDSLKEGTTYFTVSAKQSAGEPVTNGTVRLAIKDANGNTVKYVTAKKEFGATPATFGAAFKLEAGMTAEVSIDGGILGGDTIGAAQ